MLPICFGLPFWNRHRCGEYDLRFRDLLFQINNN